MECRKCKTELKIVCTEKQPDMVTRRTKCPNCQENDKTVEYFDDKYIKIKQKKRNKKINILELLVKMEKVISFLKDEVEKL